MGEVLARWILGGMASLTVVGVAGRARADEPCARLDAAHGLAPAWADAVRELEQQLAQLPPAECAPMTLSIEPFDGGVRLVVVAGDGRRAERRVDRPSLLVAVAMGLVISIPRDGGQVPVLRPPTDSTHAQNAAPFWPGATSPVDTGRAAPSAQPAAAGSSPRTSEVWLGLALGGRFGVPSSVAMVDIEARADLLVDRLLFFASFRNVPVGYVPGQTFDGDTYRESSIGFGVGRRFPLGPSAIEVAIAPSLVTMRMEIDTPERVRDNEVELRVGASARLSVPLSKSWRFTVTADTDVIPDGLRSALRVPPLPTFPSWTSGLRIGAAGALL
jgi:hypothetical protein